MTTDELWLDPISEDLRKMAITALKRRDPYGFLCTACNEHSLSLVYWNIRILQTLGLYESALLHAFTATRTNNRGWPVHEMKFLFKQADREKLHAAGDPLPGPGPFVLFRGVGGRGPARRNRGFSWTSDFDRACFFANRFKLDDPAVLTAKVDESDVLAYTNGREESEFIVMLPESVKVAKVRLP